MNKKDNVRIEYLERKYTFLEDKIERLERDTRWYVSFMEYLPINGVITKICEHLKILVISAPSEIRVEDEEVKKK
jgi:hypothetical protein